MPQIQRILSFFFLIAVVLAALQCARRGTPTGGPKDTTPPVLLKAEPENLTTEFKAKKIKLYFTGYKNVDIHVFNLSSCIEFVIIFSLSK